MKSSQMPQFNILSGAGKKHSCVGTLNLSNLSSILVNTESGEVVIDLSLIHAKSKTERGIKFTSNEEELGGTGVLYWVIWITVDQNELGSYYAGVAGCKMIIDREKRIGYKNLADHVNQMDASLKRKLSIDMLSLESRKLLQHFLMDYDEARWNNSSEAFQEAFG